MLSAEQAFMADVEEITNTILAIQQKEAQQELAKLKLRDERLFLLVRHRLRELGALIAIPKDRKNEHGRSTGL